MNNASLELGGTNWAEKDGNILGYSVGDTSGKYSPQEFTFARGSNLSATRIDRAGLIVKGRENLLLQSNQFDTTWASINVSETGGQAGYDGTNDAWVLTDNTATNIHSLAQYGIWPNSLCTGSIYVKAGSLSKFYVSNGTSGVGVFFNLSNGSVEGVTGAVIAQSITSVGGGWYRLSVTMQSAGTFLIGAYQTFVSGNYNASTVYTGTGTGTIYIQDAQLEQGLAASPYIPTTTTSAQAGVLENTPRLNYTTGVANPYLLLEPSRTNLLGYSELFSNWAITGSITISANQVVSPEGVINASIIDFSSTGAGGGVYVFGGVPSSSVSRTIYLKGAVGGETLDFSDPSQGGGSNITLTTEWQRFEYTGGSAALCGIWLKNSAGNIIYAYGAQIEEGSYPTSYIPTYSVSATRASDNCYKTDASDVIGQTEGTMFVEVDLNHTSAVNDYILQVSESSANRILLYKDSTNKIGCFALIGSTAIYTQLTSGAFTGINKIAFAYKSGDFAFYVNGTQIGTSTATFSTSATFDRLDIDSNILVENGFFNYNQAALYKERLTNAELATLTTI